MTTTRPCEPSARQALWVGGVLVLLAGLFGMHGLDSHGTAGMGSMTEASWAESATSVAGAAQVPTSYIAQDAVSAVASVAVVTGHRFMDMGMAGMCLAILAVALIEFLRLLSGHRVRPVAWVGSRPGRAPGGVGRHPGSPALFSLSIQRC